MTDERLPPRLLQFQDSLCAGGREGGRREINCDRMQIRHGAIRQRRPTRSTRAEETTVAATFPLSTNDERVAEVERGGEKLKEALWCPPPPLLELGLDHPIRRDENDAADVATKQGMKGEKVSSRCYSKIREGREYWLEEHPNPKEEESNHERRN